MLARGIDFAFVPTLFYYLFSMLFLFRANGSIS